MKKKYTFGFAVIAIILSLGLSNTGNSRMPTDACDEAEGNGICVGSGETCKIGYENTIDFFLKECGKSKDGAAVVIEFE